MDTLNAANRLTTLKQHVENRSACVGVIGLGYVGLPVACMLADVGFMVTGVDMDAPRVAEINAGRSPIQGIEPGLSELVAQTIASGRLRSTIDMRALADARVVLIAVDTPVQPNTHQPLYQNLRSALTSLGQVLQPGTLVIIESTVAPGTMTKMVIPTLREISGLVPGQDFWVGHCPERVMPGRLLHNLRKMDRVVGGQTPDVAGVMVALYRSYVEGTLDPTDSLTAELVKTGENAYRDLNIAFANEMALICEAVGGDVWLVRDLINKSPGRNMLFPGAGVGGHCIPKDPWLLAYGANEVLTPHLIPAARAVNEGMPGHMVRLIEDALREGSIPIREAKIAVLGYSYLENSDDTRHTPTENLLDCLIGTGAQLVVQDPFVSKYQTDVWKLLKDADCVVLMVAHNEYRQLDLTALAQRMRHAILVDGRHVFDEAALRRAGFIYRILGKGNSINERGNVP